MSRHQQRFGRKPDSQITLLLTRGSWPTLYVRMAERLVVSINLEPDRPNRLGRDIRAGQHGLGSHTEFGK